MTIYRSSHAREPEQVCDEYGRRQYLHGAALTVRHRAVGRSRRCGTCRTEAPCEPAETGERLLTVYADFAPRDARHTTPDRPLVRPYVPQYPAGAS